MVGVKNSEAATHAPRTYLTAWANFELVYKAIQTEVTDVTPTINIVSTWLPNLYFFKKGSCKTFEMNKSRKYTVPVSESFINVLSSISEYFSMAFLSLLNQAINKEI